MIVNLVKLMSNLNIELSVENFEFQERESFLTERENLSLINQALDLAEFLL